MTKEVDTSAEAWAKHCKGAWNSGRCGCGNSVSEFIQALLAENTALRKLKEAAELVHDAYIKFQCATEKYEQPEEYDDLHFHMNLLYDKYSALAELKELEEKCTPSVGATTPSEEDTKASNAESSPEAK